MAQTMSSFVLLFILFKFSNTRGNLFDLHILSFLSNLDIPISEQEIS
jgi:hypothetical protein